ncbi:hypothetical protein AK830_g9109 [Neonectria ditissima]|uniref:ubiquitinyl hydrolase 1 n=1 Tax=Neonectria ditissima TaxID=78410 RepID=A0A0P7AVL1_9HYPO|nr:hypothetical protein AK830_g9109 [Neonectria ditissima]
MATSAPDFQHCDLSVNDALYNHLVLPPRLPHRQDPNIVDVENELVERVLRAARHMRNLPKNELGHIWDAVGRSIQATKAINFRGRIDCSILAKELNALSESDFIIVHVQYQNCALFIRRSHDSVLGPSVIFEAFETAARNEDILAAENALQWDFPGCAVAVAMSTFLDEGFVNNLSKFLESTSRESVHDFSAHTFKAGAMIVEYRNTPEPSLITSMLMGLLEENGRRFEPKRVQKMIRDDVCWKNAKKPWRRLPYWLVLRVAISRYLCLRLGDEVGRAEYKFFVTYLLGEFCHDIQGPSTNIERLDYLKKKICRRVVKLEVDKERSQGPATAPRMEFLFRHVNPWLQKAVQEATELIEAAWGLQKLKMAKIIPTLPRQAAPNDIRLDLHVSRARLHNITLGFSKPRRRDQIINRPRIDKSADKHLKPLARIHSKLVDEEMDCKRFCLELASSTAREQRKAVGQTATKLMDYMDHALKLYEHNPTLMSIAIITVMDLWVKIDEQACSLYPLLREFHPIFRPEMLDALLSPSLAGMKRVQRIQLYLQDRISKCERFAPDIFEDPVPGSFGHRFYEESLESVQLKELHEAIEDRAEAMLSQKEKEWQEKSEEYASLTKKIDESSCLYLDDEENPLYRRIHDKSCPRCRWTNQLRRMRIEAFEHPLPSDPVVAKAVVFELACPGPFAAYRDVTWQVISRLARPFLDDVGKPRCLIREYAQLVEFTNETTTSCSLASRTKPFLTTHYASLSFPVEWKSGKDGVCRPNGLRLTFFDSATNTWPARRNGRLNFLSHVKLQIPSSSPFSKLLQDPAFYESIYGPSSYEIVSTASKCPQGINVHEYLAFQTVASGKSRRWLSILTELGSANLNFSNEATMLLLGHLTAQCGPPGTADDPFRLIHGAFRDRTFCDKLIQQLSLRLDTLSANWRETYLMETIITVTLRIVSFSAAAKLKSVEDEALTLLARARHVCVRWFKLLRAETYKVTDAETAQRSQKYTLWAGLLCKQTFAVFSDEKHTVDEDSLQVFIQGSIIVHDSLVVEVSSLPMMLQHAVIRDMRMSHFLSRQISSAIIFQPHVFGSSLKEMWPEEENCARKFSHVTLQASGWISCQTTSDEENNEQSVLYNCVEGVLLVDGCPMGKLPEDQQKSPSLHELFGDQVLLTFPSCRPRMQYTLCVMPRGFEVHVGFDNSGDMVIRAFRRPYSLQLIPRETFRHGQNWDLPGPLIDGCFHWLNLRNGEVLITKSQRPWPELEFQGYKISLEMMTCTQTRVYKNKTVVDGVVNPYSPLFNRAARILEAFEYRKNIMVVQPGGSRHLQVELPRLQILFYVNQNKLLQSPQLQCQIEQDQDAGTWYGLQSKLVCSSIANPAQKSILVPLGKFSVARSDQCHVKIVIDPNGSYGRFPINKILGRLDCAAEPVLVYMKALLHACTSFVIPDPLTGRTGTEEAIEWLQSGISQPWAPLSPGPMEYLAQLSRLTPRREYYPHDLRVMRTDHWIETFPVTIQSSAFKPIVTRILQMSKSLGAISDTNHETEQNLKIPPSDETHLHTRALLRHQAFERHVTDASARRRPAVMVYSPRDRPSNENIGHRNVMEVTHWIRKWPQSLETTESLIQLLAAHNVVGGFCTPFDKASLSDRLNVDIAQNWGSLVLFVQNVRGRYSLMFLLGLMAFRIDAKMPLIRTLIAFALFNELQTIDTPAWDEFTNFQPDQVPQLDYILNLLKPFRMPPPENDIAELEEFASAKQKRKWQTERLNHERKVEDDCKILANFLLAQWPCLEPSDCELPSSLLVDVNSALEAIRPEWRRLYMNADLTAHLRRVQTILDRRTSKIGYIAPVFVPSEDIFATRLRGNEVPDLRQLLLKPLSTQPFGSRNGQLKDRPFCFQEDAIVQGIARPSWPWNTSPGRHQSKFNSSLKKFATTPLPTDQEVAAASFKLKMISHNLGKSKSVVRKRYAAELQKSLAAFQSLNPTIGALPKFRQGQESTEATSRKVEAGFRDVKSSLDAPGPNCSPRQIKWLQEGNLWPVITKGTVLGQLASIRSQELFGSGMRKCLIELGVSITELQREIRLNDLVLKNASGQYREEKANTGHTNWNPDEYPDWLLLEIESNMMIRPVQIDVALATISPESGKNSVLQMNMGQGKTSCIIPMVAAALADKTRLVRVIVPKALLQQNAQLLQSRLGGILGRKVRHIPFSRRTPNTKQNIGIYDAIHKDMMKSAGIMICQPEHIMSFMLSGRQRLLDNQLPQAESMIKVQDWLTRVSRDILDESDYTLAVRTQLIYPSGSQMNVDGHPHRWLVAEAVLRLVDGHVFKLSLAFQHSIRVLRRTSGGFPLLFFLRTDVEDELIRKVTADICQGLGGILPMTISAMPQADRVAVKDFISAQRPRPNSINRIQRLCPDRPSIRQIVYLLRGLLVDRILMSTLRKRWNVEYGLHPHRDPIAVPFHAKGVPSEQSEWGHPDVAILLTCLAFYYDGINLSQLRQCLEHILKSDDPSTEYDKWTASIENYPSSLKAWNSINVDDEIQLTEIWRNARYDRVVIDYFLNNFVFPQHAKQFKVKLQSNGWDIPLFPLINEPSGKKPASKPLTTGFSGTNDNRTMLPLNIKQQDLPSLLHTSAEVLTYLLHPRNRHCVLPHQVNGGKATGRPSEIDLLYRLKERSIRVLIDAGAQILEMDNFRLAQEWLKVDGSALAAMYFDEGNKPWVVTKQGRKTPLLASPFADDLQMCLVYLDEAHTRGTDLKLPPQARGALTLGLGQTKDHTVQAAMRLRQLGTTQSVTFFVPPEVHQGIADLQEKTMYEPIDSEDVIEWLLNNTCESIEQLQPLYYSQGKDFCRRMQATLSNPNFLKIKSQRDKYVATIKQDEQQTLQQLYDPKQKARGMQQQTSTNKELRSFINELDTRRRTFQDTGRAVRAAALQQVEQEREVAFEVESVRQVKRPQHYAAHSFQSLHSDLEVFARTGNMPADAHYFTHVFASLSKTGLGRKFRVSRNATDSRLFVTGEFEKTIKQKLDDAMDNFLRPVNWILWSPVSKTAVIIIPEEADVLIPMLRDPNVIFQTYLLTYSAPITRKMLQFNDLNYYSIPPLPRDWTAPQWLRIELGIFSGRLYFEWGEYENMCKLLGINDGVADSEDYDASLTMDGAGDEAEADPELPAAEDDIKFSTKPLTFIQEWLAVRRRGQDFAHSPMGFISQGKSMHAEHPFFNQTEGEKQDQNDLVFAPLTHRAGHDDQTYQGEDYHGVDDMGANEAADSDAGDDHIEYDQSEYCSSGSRSALDSGASSE